MTARLRAYAAGFRGFQPDARLFLVTTVVAGAAIGLYWVDFYLYLAALDFDNSTIGIVAAISSFAAAIASIPTSAISDRIGRRLPLAGGIVLMVVATIGFIAVTEPIAIAALVAVYAVGQQAFFVVTVPFMAEHSRPEERNELFSLQFALSTGSNIIAVLLGGGLAAAVATGLGLAADADVYRVILGAMVIALVVALVTVARLGDDRPRVRAIANPAALGEPAAWPTRPPSSGSAARIGLTVVDRGRFVRLVLPGFLIALGAGQVIPFLNLFIQGKFGLDLAQLNVVFAITSLGTVVAIMVQPAIARRLGQVGSVVAVQGASIPFLVVLGFSPILGSVILAMAVRNSLMNAGNPIQNAFAMRILHPAERASWSATTSFLWSTGWIVAGAWYAILQRQLGFEAGYAVAFITIIILYSTATLLFWWWFHRFDERITDPVVASG